MKLHYERKFDAAHRLHNENRSDEWNKAVFGKCNNLPCHGHTWRAVVEVEGTVDSDTGMIINFNELKKIIDELDHKFVNDVISLPTAENICIYLLQQLLIFDEPLDNALVRVYESETSYVEETWKVN